jgi:regulator of protease activity HflC (stomatin/prohibitin superfamily)
VDTLIGDIVPPEALMKTLTDRKLAEQEKVTYGTQKEAQQVRKELAQAQAQADTQPQVVNAERQVEIATFEAQTKIRKAEGDAQSKRINAEADASVLRMVGEAEGEKINAVGNAEAEVLKKKGDAINPGNYATIEVAKALAASGMKLVPDVVAGGTNGSGGSLVDVLLAQLVTGKLVAERPEPRK